MIKEACVGNYLEALKAEINGANRIELCDNLGDGGTTPSYGTILMAKQKLTIPVVVMIRPRGGDFCYDETELEIMERDIEICREIGVAGIAFGVLLKNNEINEVAVKRLVKIAYPMETVFHMAFDETKNLRVSMNSLIGCGINRILTKGGKMTAVEGVNMLKVLHENADGQITIMAGGKVTSENYTKIAKLTGITQLHGKNIVNAI